MIFTDSISHSFPHSQWPKIHNLLSSTHKVLFRPLYFHYPTHYSKVSSQSVAKMPTRMMKKPVALAKDDTALCRPKGVFTDEERERRKSEGTPRRTTGNFNQHQRAQALAQAFRDGHVKTQVTEWTPQPLSDGTYGSEAMRELCEEFGSLAADIVQDFTGGK